MTAIDDSDLRAIKAAAEKAGGREWFLDPNPLKNGLAQVDDGASMWPIVSEWPQAEFVALANPETVIAIITELQSYRSQESGEVDEAEIEAAMKAFAIIAHDMSPEEYDDARKAANGFDRAGIEKSIAAMCAALTAAKGVGSGE